MRPTMGGYVLVVTVALCCLTVSSALPVTREELQSKVLERLMMSESEDAALALRDKRTIGVLRELFPEITKKLHQEPASNRVEQAAAAAQVAAAEEAQLPAESANNEVRVQFADESPSDNADDGGLAPLDDVDPADDEGRDKRYSSNGFGSANGAAPGGAGGAGSGGGTGNFIFDVIRLVFGSTSGSSSTSDPAAGAPTPGPATEAVPGPVTRLFVIANRGISNLIQDLILRLAATSERIVNFKARLITSII